MKEKITPGKIVLIAAAVCVIFGLYCMLNSETPGAVFFLVAFVVLLILGVTLDRTVHMTWRDKKKNDMLAREIEENMARVREQERSKRQ